MNKPPKGNSYRISNSPQLMFQVTATTESAYKMRVAISEGSFWVNNQTFVEYSGGYSPVIEAPSSGAKWVLVYIDKFGSAKLSNGLVATKTTPVQPDMDNNNLPLAFIYITSATTTITQDMIYPCHSFMQAGGYPQKHNNLEGRTADDCHPIQSITGLQDALDERPTNTEMNNAMLAKADIDGTTEASFILNKDHTGVPIAYAGVYVNRGSEAKVGFRFNEDIDKWQYTNDGVEWHGIDNDKDAYDYATVSEPGMVQLSVDADDPAKPIVVGDNDPRLANIDKKLDASVIKNYYTQEEIDAKLDNKIDADNVYNKYDSEQIFITRAEYDSGSTAGYTKNQINALLTLKANASGVYSKDDITNILSDYYTQKDIDQLLADIASGGGVSLANYYTSKEVDALIKALEDKIYIKDVIDAKLDTIDTKLDTKANVADIYSRAEVDSKIASASLGSGTGTGTTTGTGADMSNYYTRSEVNLLIDDRADKSHGHVATDISQDSTHRMVTDDEITYWNSKQNTIGYTAENTANKGVANGYAGLDANGKVPLAQLPAVYTSGSGSSNLIILSTYADLLTTTPEQNKEYLVIDATADTSVAKGAATYIYNGTAWQKISEQDSVDAVTDWSNITNKPATFAPDKTQLTEYAQTANVYSKTEVDNLLANKSDNTHTHADYVTTTTLTSALADKLDATDEKVHTKYTLGSYTVNETTAPTDGASLVFNATTHQLDYKVISGGSGTNTGSVTVDYTKLGNYNVSEPSNMKENDVLTYNGVGLTYKSIDSILTSKASVGHNKVLAYNATSNSLVFNSLPANLLDIDDSNKQAGYVLAYNATGKLEYVAQSAGSGSGSSMVTETLTNNNDYCIVRADKKNAVTNFAYSSNVATITIDKDATLDVVQLYLSEVTANTTITVQFAYSDGSAVPSHAEYKGIIPNVNYFYMDGSNKELQAVSFNDKTNALKFQITSSKNYPYKIKINF